MRLAQKTKVHVLSFAAFGEWLHMVFCASSGEKWVALEEFNSIEDRNREKAFCGAASGVGSGFINDCKNTRRSDLRFRPLHEANACETVIHEFGKGSGTD